MESNSNGFFEYIVLTKKSFEFQTRVLSGEHMEFTKIEVGDGKLEGNEDLSLITEIKNQITTGTIISVIPDDNMVKLTLRINSEGLTKATLYREIGVYARIGDEEVLYAYINSGEMFDYIVPLSKQNQRDFSTNIIQLYIVVGDAQNIDVTINNTVIIDNSINIDMLDDSVKEYVTNSINDAMVNLPNGQLKEYIENYVNTSINNIIPNLPTSNGKFELIQEDENNYIGLIREKDLEEVNNNDFILNL